MATFAHSIAQYLMDVDMFPVFFTAHFMLSCFVVREDSRDLGPRFRQNHPFAMWMCSVMASLSGVFLANFLFGDCLIDVMKEHALIAFLTIIWYLMNYSPYDIVYKTFVSPPIILSACVLQELLRVRFIYLGLHQTLKVYPGAYIIALLGGTIKGNGYGFIKIAENLVRGKWNPSTNDILEITYFAKSGFYASVVFLLHHLQLVPMSIQMVYLGLIVLFVACRMMVTIKGLKNPFQFFESPICVFIFGSGEIDDKSSPQLDKKDGEKKKE